MSIDITPPYINLPNSGTASAYFAAHNPMIIEVQRKDYAVTGTSDDGSGNVLIQAGTPFTDVIGIGDYVYINSGAIDGVYPILANPNPDEITIGLAYSAVTSGGYVNLITARPDYKVKAYVYKTRPYSSNSDLFGTTGFTPNQKGLALCDLSHYMRGATNMKEILDPSALTVNKADTNMSAVMFAVFEESYYGASPSLSSAVPMLTVNCARQNGVYGGSNLYQHVIETTGSDLAKWFNDIPRPTRWMGVPFDIQFLYSGLFLGYGTTLKLFEAQYDRSGNLLTVTSTNLSNTELYYLNRVQLSSSYAAGTAYVSCYIGDGTKTFTEELIIDIEECTPRYPVCIRWYGKGGGINYWCFQGSKERGIKWTSGDKFENPKNGLNLVLDSGRLLGKNSSPQIVVGAEQLSTEKIQGLETLLESSQVEMLVYRGSLDPTMYQWHTVTVVNDNLKFDTTHHRHGFECTLELEMTNSQTQ